MVPLWVWPFPSPVLEDPSPPFTVEVTDVLIRTTTSVPASRTGCVFASAGVEFGGCGVELGGCGVELGGCGCEGKTTPQPGIDESVSHCARVGSTALHPAAAGVAVVVGDAVHCARVGRTALHPGVVGVAVH